MKFVLAVQVILDCALCCLALPKSYLHSIFRLLVESQVLMAIISDLHSPQNIPRKECFCCEQPISKQQIFFYCYLIGCSQWQHTFCGIFCGLCWFGLIFYITRSAASIYLKFNTYVQPEIPWYPCACYPWHPFWWPLRLYSLQMTSEITSEHKTLDARTYGKIKRLLTD